MARKPFDVQATNPRYRGWKMSDMAWALLLPVDPERRAEKLEAALCPVPPPSRVPRPDPDWGRVHRELHRHKGVTLQLLWLEYRAAHSNGYQYSWFCERYKAWRGQLYVVMRQVFVGVLGASNYTFVDVTWIRTLLDWTM